MKKYGNIFVSAAAAGIGITVGGTVFLSSENQIVGALLFTVGLYAIVLNDLCLYTGKIGYLTVQEDKKSYGILLFFTWLGNLAGTALGASCIRISRVGGIRERAADIVEAKLSDTPLSILILAVFCGFLMYVAVDGYRKQGNPILLFLCVSVFILSGFEHCVANMFYFTLAGAWSVKAVLYVLLMTLGNSVGGLLIPVMKRAGGDR